MRHEAALCCTLQALRRPYLEQLNIRLRAASGPLPCIQLASSCFCCQAAPQYAAIQAVARLLLLEASVWSCCGSLFPALS